MPAFQASVIEVIPFRWLTPPASIVPALRASSRINIENIRVRKVQRRRRRSQIDLPPPSLSSLGAETLAPSARIRSNRVPSPAHLEADKVLAPDLSPFLRMRG